MLSGKRGGSEVDVSAFLSVCRIKGDDRDQLLALCREQNTPGWFQQYGPRLPQQLVMLIDHENKAVTISEFQEPGMPGLLQTGDYARAVISRSGNVPADEVADRVAARLARQSLFSRDRPARFTFFIHEFVLRLPVGGPAVMSDQLHHLLRGNCVEVGWRTSSHSGTAGNCVEVAPVPDGVLVRDSKHRDGPALTVPTTA